MSHQPINTQNLNTMFEKVNKKCFVRINGDLKCWSIVQFINKAIMFVRKKMVDTGIVLITSDHTT